MGNITKTSVVGIDVQIQSLQTAIYDYFISFWSITDNDWNSYGRLYKNFDNEGKEYLPYPFQLGNEYENPVLFQDTVKVQSFFDISESIKVDECGLYRFKCVLYFFVDLEKLFGLQNDRFDEKIVSQVNSFISYQYGFLSHSKRIGIKEVLKDYSGYAKNVTMIANMQPLFCFSIECEISEFYINFNNFLTSNYQQPNINLIPFTRYNPIGIDLYIQKFQIDLFNFILGIFDGSRQVYGTLNSGDYNCFGRCYRNYKDKEYFPQAFVEMASTGSMEYVNILFEDTCSLQSFFDIGETMRVGSELMTHYDLRLFFFVNLEKLYPGSNYRMDEEFITLISKFVMESSPFLLTKQHRGIKSIMSEYSGYKIKTNSKANMQPFLCFRLDMTSYYDDSLLCLPVVAPISEDHQFNPNDFNPQQFS